MSLFGFFRNFGSHEAKFKTSLYRISRYEIPTSPDYVCYFGVFKLQAKRSKRFVCLWNRKHLRVMIVIPQCSQPDMICLVEGAAIREVIPRFWCVLPADHQLRGVRRGSSKDRV